MSHSARTKLRKTLLQGATVVVRNNFPWWFAYPPPPNHEPRCCIVTVRRFTAHQSAATRNYVHGSGRLTTRNLSCGYRTATDLPHTRPLPNHEAPGPTSDSWRCVDVEGPANTGLWVFDLNLRQPSALPQPRTFPLNLDMSLKMNPPH